MAQEITQSLFGLDAPMREPQRAAGLEGVLQRLETGASAGIRRGFGQKTAVEAQQAKFKAITQQMQEQGIDIASPQGLTELGNRLTSAGLTGMGTAMMMQGRNQFLSEQTRLAEIKTMSTPKPNVLSDSDMLIAQGLGIPTNDNFGNPRDITSYTQEESNAILKKKQEQKESIAKAATGNDIDIKDVTKLRESRDLHPKGEAVTRLEAINEIENLLEEAPKAGVGGTVIPALQRAFIKLSEGSSARVSDKDVERILGVENFVDTRISELEKFISGTLSSKKIQSLKDLVKVYKRDSIKNYNTRRKLYDRDVDIMTFSEDKKNALKSVIPPPEFYLKSPTESVPVGQTKVIEKNIPGIGTVKVRIKGNSNKE